MQLTHRETLVNRGSFTESDEYEAVNEDIVEAINAIAWPPGNDRFVIRPERNENGVSPIKDGFIQHLKGEAWRDEERLDIAVNKRPGPIDAVYEFDDGGYFAAEWETGNISSSHRALNKMCVGIIEDTLKGGALILPSGNLYPYVTDRVGNYPELVPYFPVWKSLQVGEGYLGIYVVEHDETDENVETIDKGTDGRALV